MHASQTISPLFCRLATSANDIEAVQRLRYRVFVAEWGADGPGVDHDLKREADHFDGFADHLLLVDPNRPEPMQVVGTYRLMTADHAIAAGYFYSASEFDLTPLTGSGRKVLEVGRSCLHPDYRGGTALLQLWQGIGRYVTDHSIDVLFGVASFHGTNPDDLAQPLNLLQSAHLAPADLRVRAHGTGARAIPPITTDYRDRRAAMLRMPALIKAYLRLGGVIGEGIYVDEAFKTIDVCMLLEAAHLTARQRALYGGGAEHEH